ncbi:antiterminator LoaP [Lysinibacillus sp. NPDC092081]|uniref:antiterminator LoaP n=1 Tax=Lysinibacillus sp. NPDC092081 TaxID=3364131 RepID=UPI003825369C
MEWYVLFVENGKEEIVKRYIQLHFDEHSIYPIVPKRKVPEKKAGIVYPVLKKIFPGYVLIKTNMNGLIFRKIREIPRCYRLVNSGLYYSKEKGTYYSKIDEKEVELLLRLLENGEIIEYSKIHFENSDFFVKSGPLKEMEFIIKKIDKRKNRAKIILNLLGTEQTIDVGIEITSEFN